MNDKNPYQEQKDIVKKPMSKKPFSHNNITYSAKNCKI